MLNRLWIAGPIVALALALTGCASTQLSVEQRASLKKISIAKIEMPDKPTIYGENALGAFLLGGPIGIALTQAGSDVPTAFKQALDRSRTDVAAIVKEDLATQLTRRGFEVVAAGDARADAVLVVKVLQYGLTGDIFASPPVRVPALWVRIDLTKPGSGETLWWHWASVHASPGIFERLEARPVAEYFSEPAVLRSQFVKASTMVTEAAVAKL